MYQERKEYRKKFNSSGQLYFGGELLEFVSYDVSVKGILVEVLPGSLLADVSDFEALLKENNLAELYVKDLMLTGETDVAWVREENGKILLGLEFKDVIYNAEKLWIKRRYYRSAKPFSGCLVSPADEKIEFEGVNVSIDGLAIRINQINAVLEKAAIVKLKVKGLEVRGMGKIIWINTFTDGHSILGLRYLTLE